MIRALSSADIDRFLAGQSLGHLGCVDAGKPYVIPLVFAYGHGVFYGQTIEGRKTKILRKNPTVCFQVEHENESGWISVICYGTYEELDFDKLISEVGQVAVHMITRHLKAIQSRNGIEVPFISSSGKIRPVTVEGGKKATLFRIVVNEKSGREYYRE